MVTRNTYNNLCALHCSKNSHEISQFITTLFASIWDRYQGRAAKFSSLNTQNAFNIWLNCVFFYCAIEMVDDVQFAQGNQTDFIQRQRPRSWI